MIPAQDQEEEDGEEGALELGDVSLEELEEREEEDGVGHRVTTFDPSDDGENYFDGAYFDE